MEFSFLESKANLLRRMKLNYSICLFWISDMFCEDLGGCSFSARSDPMKLWVTRWSSRAATSLVTLYP